MRARGRKGGMRKLLVGLAAAGTMLIALPASAEPPERGLPPLAIQGAQFSDACGFDVRIDFAGKQALIDFGDRVRLLAPGQQATLTNLETGESTRVNISGPGTTKQTPTADGGFVSELKATGSWLHLHADEILWARGLVFERIVVDGDGNLVDREEDLSRARVVDLCETLS